MQFCGMNRTRTTFESVSAQTLHANSSLIVRTGSCSETNASVTTCSRCFLPIALLVAPSSLCFSLSSAGGEGWGKAVTVFPDSNAIEGLPLGNSALSFNDCGPHFFGIDLFQPAKSSATTQIFEHYFLAIRQAAAQFATTA